MSPRPPIRPRTFILLQLIPLLLASSAPAGESPWVITPGLGHDQFEQTYFLEDTLEIAPDSLRALRRTIEELKESYVSLEGAYGKGFTALSNTSYRTDAADRNVTQGRTRLRKGTFRLDANGRLEWKGDDRRDSISSSYWVRQITATPRLDVTEHWSLFTRGDWERTDYSKKSPFGLDYERIRGRVGSRYSGTLMETIEFSLGATSRDVPDSTRLSYDETWAQLEAAYWAFGPTTLSLLLSYRDRVYLSDETVRNHGRGALEMEARWQAAERARVDGQVSWEYWDYRQDSGAYYDFSAGVIEIAGRYSLSAAWEIAAVGRSRWEHAASSPFDEDNFSQLGGGPHVSWRPGPFVWMELAALWGKRSYGDASLVYDDYDFVQLDLRADGSVGEHVILSLAALYEQENHEDPSRDTDYAFGSFALRFPFRL